MGGAHAAGYVPMMNLSRVFWIADCALVEECRYLCKYDIFPGYM
jgi:hypothetical protein